MMISRAGGLVGAVLVLGVFGAAPAHAQTFQQTILPTAGSRHMWFGSALASEGDTLVVGDPEYRKGTDFCPGGYGAVAIYKKSGGTWNFSQRFVHTAGNQETKLGASIVLKGNILVAGAQREDYSSSIFRNGAIFFYKRANASSTFEFKSKLFAPGLPGTPSNDFTGVSGIAANTSFAAGAEISGKVHVYRILSDGTATFATTITAPHAGMNALYMTNNNVLVMTSSGDRYPFAYQLTQSGSTTSYSQIDTTSLEVSGDVSLGAMAGDGNSIILAKRYTLPQVTWRAIQVVKFGSNGSIALNENHYLSRAYDGMSSFGGSIGGSPQLAIKENQGFFVGFFVTGNSFAAGFKYANNTYNYAGTVSAAGAYGFPYSDRFASAVAYNGTELFVGDNSTQNVPGGSNPCNEPGNRGSVQVFTPRTTAPTGPGSSRELASWLHSQDSDQGAVVATNGSFVAAGSAYAYQGPNSLGDITLYQNVNNSWTQIEKYIDSDPGFNGFGTAVDLSSEFLAIGVPFGKNPNTSELTGMVYLQQNTGSGFSHSPGYSKVGPPNALPAYARFGSSLALDGTTLVVGAPGVNRAYVYAWNGSWWDGPKELVPSSSQTTQDFGFSVSVSGDYVVVGAPYRTYTSTSSTGAVQFFRKNSSGNYVGAGEFGIPSSIPSTVALGRSVSIARYNAVAGAPSFYAITYKRQSGATTWTQDTTVLNAAGEFAFGESAAIQGNDLLLGSSYTGKVRRYARSGNAFVQTGLLQGSTTGAFGDSLDLYNDGTTSSVAIGDFDARIANIGSGAAYFLGLSQVQ